MKTFSQSFCLVLRIRLPEVGTLPELLLEAEKPEISGFTKLFPVLSNHEPEKRRKFPVLNIENRKNRKFPYFSGFAFCYLDGSQNSHLAMQTSRKELT